MNKRALGIFIDEYQLKAALLVNNGKQVEIEALEAFNLNEQLEERDSMDSAKEEKKLNMDDQGFGVELEEKPVDFDDADKPNDGKSNIDTIIDIINHLIPKGTRVGFNLSNSFTLYKNINDMQEHNRKKIKQMIWSDFYEGTVNDAKFENVGYLKRNDGSYLSVVHDDPLVLAALFDEATSILRTQPIKLSLVDTIEFSLANELVKSYEFEQEDHTAVIVFAEGFTKIFFMKGPEIVSVLATIHEGADSETVCDTAFSKILFELDSGNIASLNNVVLVGEISRLDAEAYFKNRLPELEIIRFDATRASQGVQMERYENQLESFAIAIALAMKIMDEKDSTIYSQNFLPTRIRDKTAVYKIGWPGFLLLVFLFISAFFITNKSISNNFEIKKARSNIAFLNNELNGLKSVAHEVDSLRSEIDALKNNTALIDSMTKETIRWAPTIEALSNAYNDIGPFSIYKIETRDKQHMIIDMRMENRQQVVKLERFIDFSLISAVYTSELDRSYVNVTIDCLIKPKSLEETLESKKNSY